MLGQVLQFQSAPGGEAGGNPDLRWRSPRRCDEFQSAPGGEAGGNAGAGRRPSARQCFNPPPAVRPGETERSSSRRRDPSTFQSAPGGEAGGNAAAVGPSTPTAMFQSAPGGEAGGKPRRIDRECGPRLIGTFQSAPGGEAGGNAVSSARWPTMPGPFQSAPGGEAGGNPPTASPAAPMHGFNPPPAVRPGETRYEPLDCTAVRGFNPPPAVRPGETRERRVARPRLAVSIRPRR